MSGKNSIIALQSGMLVNANISPLSKKVYIELQPPGLTSNQADVDRLVEGLVDRFSPLKVPLSLMNKIGSILRESEWSATITLAQFGEVWETIDIEPGDSLQKHFGVAVDLGTTTVVGYLIDLGSGVVLQTTADYNGQVEFGEDILTRIYNATTTEGGAKLQKAATNTINGIISRLTSLQKINTTDVSALSIGANTTMVHLLLGLDPSRICMAPYIPVVNYPGSIRASEIGLKINPLAPVYLLPGVGSYVGGDIIGGILASGMHKKQDLALFVDIGTNGEIVLGNSEWLVACAGAAGPALEGGVARNGMRAEPGAIYKIKIDEKTGKLFYHTIDNAKARGICGSGLIDCLAELLLSGMITRAGKFNNESKELVVVAASESETGKNIKFTQVDIDNIMRTKGAVNAALELLMESVGCGLSDIETFYAAGAFGHYLDLESAINIGLYPDLPRERMLKLGNSSAEGARLTLISEECRHEVVEIAKKITYFELNANEIFMNKFVGSKFLPHTNLDYYPTVRERMIKRGFIKNGISD